ncbi:hypothetical protein CPB84DRAFT_1764057 [Gymnopilus junonius]|uniref:F-box domain-containing protein n=1 Tax=Gymnopilus junonius TaxID=109634 RepID=A0A9P5NZH0_GYMJU|nr:hypothetical protein CPB84DRAFT_1764057 [Gymnopilus junonius]
MLDIPPEIWHYIASFVPDEELCHLLGVNSVFFAIAMDLRWKEVSIMTRNTSEAMRILKRLSDPFIANRLQRLVLRLTHVKERNTTGSQESAKDFKHLRQQFHLTINRVFKVFRKDHSSPEADLSNDFTKPLGRPTFSDVISSIISASPHFRNIHDLTIDSWDLPPSYDLKDLFTAIWSSFGANLCRLSLGGNLEGYRVLIESQPNLEKLREFHVEFTNNLFRVDNDMDVKILVELVAPFINRLNGNLHSLRVWSWANLDLSAFFARLEVLPVLEYLNIRMAFNKALTNPAGLKNLLCGCSTTLQRLDLRLNPAGLPMNPVWEEPLSLWLTECLADERCFAHLRQLDIYPTNKQVGMDFLQSCIHRTSKTLTHLTVRDRYFQPTELVLVVDSAATCAELKSLRLNVWRLDATLFDLLAKKVPEIRMLWLSVGEALSNNDHGGLGHTFLQELKQRSYANWKLKDISIWQGGQEVDDDTMLALARSIPSLSSFFGTGHMRTNSFDH